MCWDWPGDEPHFLNIHAKYLCIQWQHTQNVPWMLWLQWIFIGRRGHNGYVVGSPRSILYVSTSGCQYSFCPCRCNLFTRHANNYSANANVSPAILCIHSALALLLWAWPSSVNSSFDPRTTNTSSAIQTYSDCATVKVKEVTWLFPVSEAVAISQRISSRPIRMTCHRASSNDGDVPILFNICRPFIFDVRVQISTTWEWLNEALGFTAWQSFIAQQPLLSIVRLILVAGTW